MPLGTDVIRNRFGFHQGTGVTIPQHERVRNAYMAFAEFLDSVLPDGDAKDSAFHDLQQASMWSNFAVSEQAPLQPRKSYQKPTPLTAKPGPKPQV